MNNISFNVREIRDEDLIDVEKVYVDSVRDNVEGFIQRLDLLPNIKDFAKERQNEGGAFFVATLDEKVIGLCGLKKRENEGEFEVCRLHIQKELKGRGFGGKLFEYVLNYAKEHKMKKLVLHVTRCQQAAVHLYKKHNFVITGERMYEGNYGGEICRFDTIYMEKVL